MDLRKKIYGLKSVCVYVTSLGDFRVFWLLNLYTISQQKVML